MSEAGALARLAELCGIQLHYPDIWGHDHVVSAETQAALLEAMRILPGETEAALRQREERRWRRVLPPVQVVRGDDTPRLVLRIPQKYAGVAWDWRLTEESGVEHGGSVVPEQHPVVGQRDMDGVTYAEFTVELPQVLPAGYHHLEVSGPLSGSTLLVMAPLTCYVPPELEGDGRVWGAAVQLYALRSRRNWGIGDFSDLETLAEHAGAAGAGLIGLNPLHALFPHNPEHASPYSPSSRLFLNILYIDIEAIPEFAQCLEAQAAVYADAFQQRIEAARRADVVDYTGVARMKREVLELLYAHFRAEQIDEGSDAAQRFWRFVDAGGESLWRHALYEALQEHLWAKDESMWGWPVWPEEYRDPTTDAVRSFAAREVVRVQFFLYLQWRADQQLGRAAERARQHGLWLYQDLALSCDGAGAEAWASGDLFASGATVGAPPDDFNLQGQNWGLPPLIPDRLRETGYASFVAALRANMRHAGALRIDHVMGLMRMFWVPTGEKPNAGAYVHYPLDDLLGILALESQRNRCLIIGEDLGTVPDELRAALGPMQVLSYRLFFFERQEGDFARPEDYPTQALAAVSTHDLPTLAGYWKGQDIAERTTLGQFTGDEVRVQQIMARAEDRTRLLVALEREGLLPQRVTVDPASCPDMTPELARAVHSFVAKTPAKVLAVQLEDVLLQLDQVNLPGTSEERPNWRLRLAATLEDLVAGDRFQELAGAIGRHRERATRAAARPSRAVARATIPRATYRLQLHRGFNFDAAAELAPYLADLGVSHVYTSPYLKARPGSTHGYDIVDHNAINPEIGDAGQFQRFVDALGEHGLAQVLDVVPNHMGIGSDNIWWLDVLENGPASAYAGFFDIDWQPLNDALAGKVLLPVLGARYGEALEGGELGLELDVQAGCFWVRYFEHRFPVDPSTYPLVLGHDLDSVMAELGGDEEHVVELQTLMTAFRNLPDRLETAGELAAERHRDKEVHKNNLRRLLHEYPALCRALERTVAAINDDRDALHALLEEQAYRLAYWRVAADETNYRRFFDVNDLAGLRQEDLQVFLATHRLVSELVAKGSVTGLRIDHPDGLHDPVAYYRRLQEQIAPPGSAGDGGREPLYVVVEKILAAHEHLPESWPVHGTTGYEFANLVSGLGVDSTSERELDRLFSRFVGRRIDFDELLYERKKLIMRVSLSGELHVLANQLDRVSEGDWHTRDFTLTALRDALVEVVASFPVYRTYVAADQVSAEDRRDIEWAIAAAKRRSTAADTSVFDFIRGVLLLENLDDMSEAAQQATINLALRFQQYTAPVTAKGLEDTSFYIYNRLVSLNEVGGDPRRFGTSVAAFHRTNEERARRWPHAMLATSTHDSKRSEDVRARINVISEMPDEWRAHVGRWSRVNRSRKGRVHGLLAPDRNDEYLIYQTLLGVWPVGDEPDLEGLRQRLTAYMGKAVREAKVHTSWVNPNEPYERAVERFIAALLANPERNPFLKDFVPFCRRVIHAGARSSLSQTLLKITSPGVPDIYQGNELLDLSLVDPDNRRPVDYGVRRATLESLRAAWEQGGHRAGLARGLTASVEDGRAKLHVTWRALDLRRRRPELFAHGDYRPLKAAGSHADHVVAFARAAAADLAVVVAPRLWWRLEAGRSGLSAHELWGDTVLELPPAWTGRALENLLTGERVERFDLAHLLASFPVALLA
jgi:(1->4)-alpha-D-glucan 1-alpha-D-glucosylmutase